MENVDTYPEAYPRFSQAREQSRAVEEPEKRQRIKIWMGGALVTTALTVDIIEMILDWLAIGLVLNPVILWPAANVIFFIWFKMLDVPFITSPRRFAVLAITSLAEIIPALDAIGGIFWTIGILLTVLMVRAEDKGGMIGKLSGATMGLLQARYTQNKSLFKGRVDPRELRRAHPELSIKKGEIVSAAYRKNPELSEERYGGALDRTLSRINRSAEDRLGPQTRREFLLGRTQSNTLNLKQDSRPTKREGV